MFYRKVKIITDWLNRVRKHPVIIILAFILILLSSLITIDNAFSIIGDGLSKISIVEKNNLLNQIEQLVVGSNIDYFVDKLGKPIFIDNLNDNHKEYIFYNNYFIVQAVTSQNEKVILYSVTTMDKNFNPRLSLGPYTSDGERIDVILGKTKFKDLDKLSGFNGNFDRIIGAHTYSYEESYYFGNPGFYRTYVFSLNQAGDILENSVPAFDENSESEINEYRQSAVINTYTITTEYPYEKKNLSLYFLGPDINKVRLIPSFYN